MLGTSDTCDLDALRYAVAHPEIFKLGMEVQKNISKITRACPTQGCYMATVQVTVPKRKRMRNPHHHPHHYPHHNPHHKTRGIPTTTRLSLRGLIVLAAHEQPLPQRDCQGVELNARLRN